MFYLYIIYVCRIRMNALPVIRYQCLCKEFRGRQGALSLQATRSKCIAKSCFEVQKNNFGERLTLFQSRFYC